MAYRVLRKHSTEELLADLLGRLERLEQRPRFVVGVPPNAYLLEVDAAGRLTAVHTGTGAVTVVAVP